MTHTDELAALAAEFGFDPNIEDEEPKEHTQGNADAQVRAHERAMTREDEHANSLIGRQVGSWTVLAKRELHDPPRGNRVVYVIQHKDGRVMNMQGYRLNALMADAAIGGLI